VQISRLPVLGSSTRTDGCGYARTRSVVETAGIYGVVEKPDFEQLFEPHLRFFLARLDGIAPGWGHRLVRRDLRCGSVNLKLISLSTRLQVAQAREAAS
jgi:hypothetical protein